MAAAWKVRNCPILLLLSRSLDNVSCGLCPVSDDDMDNTWETTRLSVNANTLPTTCCLPVGLIKLPSSQFIGYC